MYCLRKSESLNNDGKWKYTLCIICTNVEKLWLKTYLNYICKNLFFLLIRYDIENETSCDFFCRRYMYMYLILLVVIPQKKMKRGLLQWCLLIDSLNFVVLKQRQIYKIFITWSQISLSLALGSVSGIN